MVEGISSCLTRQRQQVPRLHVPPGHRSSRDQAAACRLAACRFAARCRAATASTARDIVPHESFIVRCGLWELGGGACAAIRRRLRLLQHSAPPWSAVNALVNITCPSEMARRLRQVVLTSNDKIIAAVLSVASAAIRVVPDVAVTAPLATFAVATSP